MIPTVFDTSTVVAAIFWPRSTARRAWTLVARRRKLVSREMTDAKDVPT